METKSEAGTGRPVGVSGYFWFAGGGGSELRSGMLLTVVEVGEED